MFIGPPITAAFAVSDRSYHHLKDRKSTRLMFKWWYDLSDTAKAAVIGGPMNITTICCDKF